VIFPVIQSDRASFIEPKRTAGRRAGSGIRFVPVAHKFAYPMGDDRHRRFRRSSFAGDVWAANDGSDCADGRDGDGQTSRVRLRGRSRTHQVALKPGHWFCQMLSVGRFGVFRIPKADPHMWADLGPAGRDLASYLLAFPGRDCPLLDGYDKVDSAVATGFADYELVSEKCRLRRESN
jgi:hypothetical protein